MKRSAIGLAAAAAAFSLTTPAMAVTVAFTNVQATWYDITWDNNTLGPPTEMHTGSGTPNTTVRWGVPQQTLQSGYGFAATNPLAVVFAGSTSGNFAVGDFTHFNYPQQNNTSASAAKLLFATDVSVDGQNVGLVNFVFNFNHTETDNLVNPCADGGTLGVGINNNGCADRVQTNSNQVAGSFSHNGLTYYLDVQGLLVNGVPTQQFWTREQATNTAGLLGQLRVGQSSVPGVPEPSTWALMILGIGLTAAAMRRRQRASVRFAF